jgi:hypothetical protein
MKSGKIVGMVACILATAALVHSIWRVRATEATRLTLRHEVADWQMRWDTALKRNADSEGVVAGLRAKKAAAAASSTGSAATPSSASGQNVSTIDAEKHAALLAESRRKFLVQSIVRLELNLRPEFERLGLSAEQWDQFEKLTVNRAPEAEIREAIGDEAFNALKKSQAELGARTEVRRLADDLRFSANSLTLAQIDQLAQFSGDNPSVLNDPDVVIPDAAMARLREILSPAQLATWLRLQEGRKFSVQFSRASMQP